MLHRLPGTKANLILRLSRQVAFGVCLLGLTASMAQAEQNWLAIVADDTITVNQYKLRFETAPHTGFDESARVDFLDALILETLLAQHANTLSPAYRTLLDQLTAEARVEAWLLDRVEQRVEIPDSVVYQHFIYALRTLTVDAWAATDSAVAEAITERVHQGILFTEAGLTIPTQAELVRGLEVKWNTTDPALEAVAFELDPGEVSEPVQAGETWWVLRLVRFEQNRIPSEHAFRELGPWVRDALEARAAREAQNRILAEAMDGVRMNIDPESWRWLVDQLAPRLAQPADPRLEIPFTVLPETSVDDVDAGDEPFVVISWPGREQIWSRAEVIERLRVAPKPLPRSDDPNQFQHQLHAHIRWLIEFATLDHLANEAGYSDHPRVLRDSLIWRDHLLARDRLNKLLGSASSLPDSDDAEPRISEPLSSDRHQALLKFFRQAAMDTEIRINRERLRELNLVDVPVLVRKRHFPNRPATPLPVGYPWAGEIDF